MAYQCWFFFCGKGVRHKKMKETTAYKPPELDSIATTWSMNNKNTTAHIGMTAPMSITTTKGLPTPPPAKRFLENIGKELRLPRPFVYEPNRCFTTIEEWNEMVHLIAIKPLKIVPLGYYRTPDDIDIYVFECTMGDRKAADKKSWKIYRRYNHFQRYVSHASALLSSSSMIIPRLSQAYMKLFNAKHCKDRLVELHTWLMDIIENTQVFSQQNEKDNNQQEENEDATINENFLPALMLGAFLLAGANHPFPHYFRGMPKFALALEQVYVEIQKTTPVFPSKVRSSLGQSIGIGIRLVGNKEQPGGCYIGARVGGFLRDTVEHKNLSMVQIGSQLVRINQLDVSEENFENILQLLKKATSKGIALKLCFVYNPLVHKRRHVSTVTTPGSSHTPRPSFQQQQQQVEAKTSRASDTFMSTDEKKEPRPSSSATTQRTSSYEENESSAPVLGPNTRSGIQNKRFYSVESRPKTQSVGGIIGSVLSDLFGRTKVRSETTDNMWLHSSSNPQDESLYLSSWDDMDGQFHDVNTRGFYTPLSKDQLQLSDVSSIQSTNKRTHGIWTSSSSCGPIGFCFGACQVKGYEAAMIEFTPMFFSSASRIGGREEEEQEQEEQEQEEEKKLVKGFLLVSINQESTFGLSFSEIMKKLAHASRPTSLLFRWFQDYSPFLESDLQEEEEKDCKSLFDLCPMDCLSEAQGDISNDLHLALVENASIRMEMTTLYEQNCHLRDEETNQAMFELQDRLKESESKLEKVQKELDQVKHQLVFSEIKYNTSIQEYHQMLETAHANAMARITAHEEKLIQESNKSITTAKLLAERKMQKLLEIALEKKQREHEEYLQKLAEEHAEEMEILTQQVKVWRHQVEMLTEAEKKKYQSTPATTLPLRHRFMEHLGSPYSSSSVSVGGMSTFKTTSTLRRKFIGREEEEEEEEEEEKDEEDDRSSSTTFPKDHSYTELSEHGTGGGGSPSERSIWDKMLAALIPK